MDKRTKLKKILAGLSNFDSGLGDAFKSVEREMQRVANKIREEADTKTVADVKEMTTGFREQIKQGLDSLVSAFDDLRSELTQNEKKLTDTLNIKLDALRTVTAEFRIANTERVKTLSEEIGNLKQDIKEISDRKIKIPDYTAEIKDIQSQIKELSKEDNNADYENCQKKIEELTKELADLRKRTLLAMSHPGGNANRNILVASNPSTLSRYTDLNLKPGTNVTLTYVNNDTLKTTDLTIAATGGAGTSRNISTVSVSSVVVATASTDIVIIASAGIKLTMPTAASNTNLYTIKNSGASSVMVVANGAETIDGNANVILNTQYTAIDLISDSSNWQIT